MVKNNNGTTAEMVDANKSKSFAITETPLDFMVHTYDIHSKPITMYFDTATEMFKWWAKNRNLVDYKYEFYENSINLTKHDKFKVCIDNNGNIWGSDPDIDNADDYTDPWFGKKLIVKGGVPFRAVKNEITYDGAFLHNGKFIPIEGLK